jgi:hypothetical protein
MSDTTDADVLVPDDTAKFISQGEQDARSALIERSCCCPSRPAVRVLLPLPADPVRTVDLLLCQHHYRVSQDALGAAGATVCYLASSAFDPS